MGFCSVQEFSFYTLGMKNDLSFHNLSVEDATELALDRPLWRLLAASGLHAEFVILGQGSQRHPEDLGRAVGPSAIHKTSQILILESLRFSSEFHSVPYCCRVNVSVK